MTNRDLFVYFITERENIRIMREMEFPSPWTDDPILRTVYFTNVDREKDKTTRFIREHVLCIDDCLYARLYLCRIFNTIEVLSNIDWSADIHGVLEQFRDLHESNGGKVNLSSAYFIPTQVRIPEFSLSRSYVEVTARNLDVFRSFNDYRTCKETYAAMLHKGGLCLGSFIVGQIIADSKYTKNSNLYEAPDRLRFTCYGPGSLVGISAYYDRKISAKEFYGSLTEAHREVSLKLESNGREDISEEIRDFHNLQNCYCEFGKYYRCLHNDGSYRVRRRYKK